MNVTDAGRRRVASLEFSSQLRDFLAKRHAEGVSEKLGMAACVNFVALALAGRDPNEPPQDAEGVLELVGFVNSHAAEINAASNACLALLMKHDGHSTQKH
jgi:hypothetical protein